MTDFYDDDASIAVAAPSGAVLYVLTEGEKDYFEDIAIRYQTDNQFVNISDVQDLDRILMMELLCFRWSSWMTNEEDYDGMAVDPIVLNKSIKDWSGEIRLTKKALGIDKAAREKESGDSVQARWETLKIRAKKFGYMRNEQANKAIELFQDLQALMTLYHNCNDEERKEQHVAVPDIIEWIDEFAIPEFNEIDSAFRKTEQTYWIRDQ